MHDHVQTLVLCEYRNGHHAPSCAREHPMYSCLKGFCDDGVRRYSIRTFVDVDDLRDLG